MAWYGPAHVVRNSRAPGQLGSQETANQGGLGHALDVIGAGSGNHVHQARTSDDGFYSVASVRIRPAFC